MDGIRILLFAAFVQATPSSPTEPSIDFYFTHEAVLEQGAAAVTSQWTAHCLAGGEFADVARGYAPDPRMSVDDRKAQAAKLDRRDFIRIATDAWQRANAALRQGPMRVCVDLAHAAD